MLCTIQGTFYEGGYYFYFPVGAENADRFARDNHGFTGLTLKAT